MEVCGTHTMAIHRAGLHSVLPENVRLLSGPGCPVCVTPVSVIDTAVGMAREYGVTIATFGDMIRVPGSECSLAGLRSEGHHIEVVYSPLDAVRIAADNPGKKIVFLAVGFETTAPAVAASILQARAENVINFSIVAAHKLVIPALELLVADRKIAVDGFILPGHVSVVLGAEPYRFLAEKHGRACVVTGFEAADIIQGLLMLLEQIRSGKFSVEIQYSRAVRPEGNPRAREMIDRIFEPVDTEWRGFGVITASGLALRENITDMDALRRFPLKETITPAVTGCRCGEVLRGRIIPSDCGLFGVSCNPDHPVGPCMVSGEGTCAAYYRYSRKKGG